MKKQSFLLFILCPFLLMCGRQETKTDFLRVSGKEIVDGEGKNILLRGIGLGGWMLQEPYMLQLSKVAGTQTEIREKISSLVGKDSCDLFYKAYLSNFITERDIDSIKAWGFNSVRLPMHYNLYTLPIEKEPVRGENTWLETGFSLTDSLLLWCTRNEMYLILDLHAAPGGQGNDRPIADVDTLKPQLWENLENQSKTVALWGRLAERYADEPFIGGYDLINETNYKMDGNQPLANLLQSITAEIRKYDENHIIFVEGNQFANDFTGLTPPWDSNMVYSFHKYWNPPTIETIRKYLDMREKFNVPLWMGESGENNNEWFREVVSLLENNNIGWAWWTIKKIESESGIMTISKPEGYQNIIDYWAGTGKKPSAGESNSVLMQLAENARLENCRINYPVLNALFGK